MNREDAAEYSESIAQVGEGWWRQLAWAYRQGVHTALGMSRQDWALRYHGYLRMQVEERREAVAELTEEGYSQREIADTLGVDDRTVGRDLTAANAAPEDEAQPQPDEATAANAAPAADLGDFMAATQNDALRIAREIKRDRRHMRELHREDQRAGILESDHPLEGETFRVFIHDALDRTKAGFMEVGEGLIRMRESKLYKPIHGTFEAYVFAEFGWTDRHARQLMAATRYVLENRNDRSAFDNEWQVRIKREQERRAGRLLLEAKESGEYGPGHKADIVSGLPEHRTTHRWQDMARVPQEAGEILPTLEREQGGSGRFGSSDAGQTSDYIAAELPFNWRYANRIMKWAYEVPKGPTGPLFTEWAYRALLEGDKAHVGRNTGDNVTARARLRRPRRRARSSHTVRCIRSPRLARWRRPAAARRRRRESRASRIR